jgi:glycosyltransferase involved in cell wall biosynthesis
MKNETLQNDDLLLEQIKATTRFEDLSIHLDAQLRERDAYIQALESSMSWKITSPLRNFKRIVSKLIKGTRVMGQAVRSGGDIKSVFLKLLQIYRTQGIAGIKIKLMSLGTSINFNDYALWIKKYDTLTDANRDSIKTRISNWEYKPKISIVMPVYDPELKMLDEAIQSVLTQLYPNWELCIADDASKNEAVRDMLKQYAAQEPRIRLVLRSENGHISKASNSALDLATGEFTALFDHDDLLAEHALFFVADTIINNPNAGLIYSDEDKVDQSGKRRDPYFKTDWNPELFLSHNSICHLGVYRTSLIKSVGGFRANYEGAQDHDLALRCIEQLQEEQIIHIPRVLYHWRIHPSSTAASSFAKPYAYINGARAIDDHLSRCGIEGHTEWIRNSGYKVHYKIPASPPLVTIIIPTRNKCYLLRKCIDSILTKTTYLNYEILIIDNGSDEPEILTYFNDISASNNIRIIKDDSPFNYSALNNKAVKLAKGDLICLMNNDIEVISPDWLTEMVSLALLPGAGVVGARLWYPNNTLQHAGVILGISGVACHAHHKAPKGCQGYFGRMVLRSNFSAVTGACVVVKKSIYIEVGGLNEIQLKVAYNDIDFCLRVRDAGYRNILTPYADLYHHESASRGYDDTPEKIARLRSEFYFMKERWGEKLYMDPAYNPNLTLEYGDFGLSWPPRLKEALRFDAL